MKDAADSFTKKILSLLFLGSLASVVLFCFSDGISGNDYWWHVKAGEWMVLNRRILKWDVFSWTVPSHAWFAHEWLSEILLYFLRSAGGNTGIFLFSLTGALLLLVLSIAVNKDRVFENVVFTCFFFLLYAVDCSLFFYGRPQVFCFFLLFGELYCIDAFWKNPDSRLIFGIPVIGLLWANLHGGSSNLSYLLLVFALVGSLPIRKGIGRLEFISLDRKGVRRLLSALLLTVAALCVNPYGYRLLAYPYEQMSDSFMTSVIAEWGAPDAKVPGELVLFFVPVGLSVSGMLLGNRKIRSYDLLLMLFFLFLFLRSRRFILMFCIAASFWAFDHVLPCRMKPVSKRYERWFMVLGAALILTVSLGYGGKQMAGLLQQGEVLQQELSEEMISFVKSQQPGALFHDYGLGGILIYHDIKVFFDGRADLYEECGLLREGCSLINLKPSAGGEDSQTLNVEQTVEKYGIDAFLIQDVDPLFSYLASHKEAYELLRQDEDGNAYFRVR